MRRPISGIVFSLVLSYACFADSNLEPPYFSVERGFYQQPFDLTISIKDNKSNVKYTLDGSDPRSSSTAILKNSPVQLSVDPYNLNGRDKAPGFIVRACAWLNDSLFSNAVTQTYFFINEIGPLSPDGEKPGPGWPEILFPDSLNIAIDYGMDPDVLNDPRYEGQITDALLSISTISLVTDLDNLFDPERGLYTHPHDRGEEWERPVSVELINPDGTQGFQINAGLRIRGGYSRMPGNSKHAFRLFFRDEYGTSSLDYPLFGDEGVDTFKKLDLRTSQNYSWSIHGDKRNTMNRDVFSRDCQKDMDQPYTRSRYYHLYINGTYWGIYQSQERSEARYAESYFGGQRENYDVIKPVNEIDWEDPNRDPIINPVEATDGNLDGWLELWDACVTGYASDSNYYKIQGLNIDGSRNLQYKTLIDIDNLIDYMLIIYYTGNDDAPVVRSDFVNNFFGILDRTDNAGFKFFVHDSEHTLLYLKANRVKPMFPTSIKSYQYLNPDWIHRRLWANNEYRIRFFDHVYKHFFNKGALTPQACADRFMNSASQIDLAIIAESARWGDAHTRLPRTRDDDWLPTINSLMEKYFPDRSDMVLNQFITHFNYPEVNPPLYFRDGQEILDSSDDIEEEYVIGFSNPNEKGIMYYTLDESDPRLPGGAVSATALIAKEEQEIQILYTTVIKSRVLADDTWSPLHEITLYGYDKPGNLKITEIHYHPLDDGDIDDSELEFIELKNTGVSSINLTGFTFVDGIEFSFPDKMQLRSNHFIVLASNKEAFFNRYGFEPSGEYMGQLDNAGEHIAVINATGDTVVSVTYDDKQPWPTLPDGHGKSLVLKNWTQNDNPDNPSSWRASYLTNGSPGKDDPEKIEIESLPDISPKKYTLYQNYPNPFNNSTTIRFDVPEDAHVTIKLYNLLGQEIETFIDQKCAPGEYAAILNTVDYSSGIYIYCMQVNNFLRTKKFILVK